MAIKELKLDYKYVRKFWNNVSPSILGPYMMEDFGLPLFAGTFRFNKEKKILEKFIKGLKYHTPALDLGSGSGFWSQYFAAHFDSVVSVESSDTLYRALQENCSHYSNILTRKRNVLNFGPHQQFGLIFLGGLLMYLNREDIITLLGKLIPFLEPGGVIICRESTVRKGIERRCGDYQAVYRSVETYLELFNDCGLNVHQVKENSAYLFIQILCELITVWKDRTYGRPGVLPIIGRALFWGFCLTYPWGSRLISWVSTRIGKGFPHLTNHFFILRPANSKKSPNDNSTLKKRD